ncbi:bifunctional riboflavin kinase/FAD synthetase [Flavobacterium sediminilitoris]|uniref:Riboflavin biosynthesis protein n=1 Tax=Flavobacterium sediminilitoris TaxID=2024526 RepID=A0ABY4HP97_9FLAO|nr:MULTISPECIES: bifunctional riboflavin kinase/FAD synthetase [Flavobacterium]UOX34706.1 bifunctional riboflavin kinase/FAD synthetase [Flavobacterium sediminilitoris]
MNIHNNINLFQTKGKTIVTIGTFDGVHLGHQKVLTKLKNAAIERKAESVLLTFFPHPRMVLQQDLDIKLLNTIEEKKELISSFGIDNLIIHPFDAKFSRLTAEDFVKMILVDQLNLCKIIIGYDHRFGRNRTATIEDLIAFGEKYNFEVEQITAKEIDEISISSTKIRTALLEGDIKTANTFLGYKYNLTGAVIEGKKIGRTINFPTANIKVSENYKLIPKNGVYVVSANIDNDEYFGMMNIGTNPTISEGNQSIEVHLFDFNKSIYDKEIKISFLERIRDERKFDSLEDLKIQLEKDKTLSIEKIEQYK